MLPPKDPTIGELMVYHRQRLGLTPNGLARRTRGQHSGYVRDIESGLRTIRLRSVAVGYADALGLTRHERDRFLWLAGYAPEIDWQRFARETLVDLGLGGDFDTLTSDRYDELEKTTSPQPGGQRGDRAHQA